MHIAYTAAHKSGGRNRAVDHRRPLSVGRRRLGRAVDRGARLRRTATLARPDNATAAASRGRRETYDKRPLALMRTARNPPMTTDVDDLRRAWPDGRAVHPSITRARLRPIGVNAAGDAGGRIPGNIWSAGDELPYIPLNVCQNCYEIARRSDAYCPTSVCSTSKTPKQSKRVLKPNSITLAGSELAPNRFGAC